MRSPLPPARRSDGLERSRPPRAFALELTKGCNLRCGYCYYAEREDAYRPSTTMSPEVARQSIDRLLEADSEEQAVHVHFFGGEPLLQFPLLQETVAYGERRAAGIGKRITFEVTTNGTRFDDAVIGFLNDHGVHVGVSFDGPPSIQDAARPAVGGGSYARAAPGIRLLLESRRDTPLEGKTHCSVVVTRRSLDLVGIVEHLEELGFRKIILSPVTDRKGEHGGFRLEDIPALRRAFDALADDYEERVLSGRRVSAVWFPSLMKRILSGERKTTPCGGGRDYLGVSAAGDVYLCYRFFENEDFSMGHVAGGIERDVTDRLSAIPMEVRNECSVCWARYYCGGGCHHDNLMTGGGLGKPNPIHCEILRSSMDRTLAIWARLSKEENAAGRVDAANEGESMDESARGLSEEDRPTKSGSIHVRDLDTERVVYSPESHEVAVLNATACLIFDLVNGSRTVGQILEEMKNRFDAAEDLLRADLFRTLEMLRSKRMISVE